MSSAFSPEMRWFAANVIRGLLVALALTPIVSALAVVANSPLDGWSGSAFEDYLGWMPGHVPEGHRRVPLTNMGRCQALALS